MSEEAKRIAMGASMHELFANWLRPYVHAIIKDVILRKDKIISNEYAVGLLRELYWRELDERSDFESDIRMMFDHPDFTKYDPHTHPLTHSESYRHILYDMYIDGIKLD